MGVKSYSSSVKPEALFKLGYTCPATWIAGGDVLTVWLSLFTKTVKSGQDKMHPYFMWTLKETQKFMHRVHREVTHENCHELQIKLPHSLPF